MKGELSNSVDRELHRWDEAVEDFRTILLEEPFRPFLATASEPADAKREQKRALLRQSDGFRQTV